MLTLTQDAIERKTITKYAIYTNREGIAICDANRAVWFVDNADNSVTLLHNADLPALMLLGDCELVAEQLRLDYAKYLLSRDDQVILDWLKQYLPDAL